MSFATAMSSMAIPVESKTVTTLLPVLQFLPPYHLPQMLGEVYIMAYTFNMVLKPSHQ
jgi:hypothetical protein